MQLSTNFELCHCRLFSKFLDVLLEVLEVDAGRVGLLLDFVQQRPLQLRLVFVEVRLLFFVANFAARDLLRNIRDL